VFLITAAQDAQCIPSKVNFIFFIYSTYYGDFVNLKPFELEPVFVALNPYYTGYIMAFVDDFILCVSVYPKFIAPPIPFIFDAFLYGEENLVPLSLTRKARK